MPLPSAVTQPGDGPGVGGDTPGGMSSSSSVIVCWQEMRDPPCCISTKPWASGGRPPAAAGTPKWTRGGVWLADFRSPTAMHGWLLSGKNPGERDFRDKSTCVGQRRQPLGGAAQGGVRQVGWLVGAAWARPSPAAAAAPGPPARRERAPWGRGSRSSCSASAAGLAAGRLSGWGFRDTGL